MAELTTLARPYARAAFDHAQAEKQLGSWADALATAANVVSHDKVKLLLASPNLTSAQKSSALMDICGNELGGKFNNFVSVLAENNRLALLPFIQALFLDLKAKLEKAVHVDVTSAFAISDETQAKLVTALTQSLEREVSIETQVDESLIGGAIIRAGDTVIDGSVKGRLAKLSDAMNA